ncbi:MAG: sulfatase-like hydrolase/transferase [Chitinophagaceae bacterium]|nr:sulfatase-like hydrolase/transferase [Chitinophagaceae bacterium]
MYLKNKIQGTIPLTIRWLVSLWIIFMLIFTVLRIATLISFMPPQVKVAEVLPAFSLGFFYDVRWVSIFLLPIALLSMFPGLSPFYSVRNKKVWSWYLAAAALFVLIFFGADFGNFSYNHTRLNASALNFAEDPGVSVRMLWQSYPLVWILFALSLTVFLLFILFRHTHVITNKRPVNEGSVSVKMWFSITILLLGWSVYGLFLSRPLKWKDAFLLNNNFTAYLALNPLQNFFSTLQFRQPIFDNEKARSYYGQMARFLGIEKENKQTKEISYSRIINPGIKSLESNPNVVLVLCESFSMYKSSMSGNPLNTTPFFQQLCNEGIFFNRCFSPTFGTARGVFALITGIPDVQLSKFSSRNPEAVNQRTIVNNFEGYNKFYFIGGSSDFNNFEGVIRNINGVQIYQEGSYQSAPLNVWGISDKDLFLEAGKMLTRQEKPFFAIIQTADNHRPFTIPVSDSDFEREIISEDTLLKYGFESLKEYQSFRYTDYCFKKFMDYAKQQSWFANTIFVFVGDHGVSGGDASAIYSNSLVNLNRLTDEHVPLLFYAPELLSPELHAETVSQIDVLPTIAGMIHKPYLNTTLGRDLLNLKNKMDAAFIIHHDEGKIGIVTDDFYFSKSLQMNKEELYPVSKKGFGENKVKKDSVMKSLSQLTSAIYETSKYLLFHNEQGPDVQGLK